MTINDEKLRLWLEAAVESAFRAGALEEHAAVVAWLRENPAQRMLTIHETIACIERGEHRREEEP